jgi:ABC-type Fe3+/spermidine/putrescine transport system ATPase subunit
MPSIYVTNGQEEALTMSNRIAVISQGLVEQAGGPEAVLRGARHRVRGRTSRRVEPHGCVRARPRKRRVQGSPRRVRARGRSGGEDTRGPARITIRPERVDLDPLGTIGENRILGMAERVVYVGSVLQLIVHPASG